MNFPSKKTKGLDENKIERNSRLNKYNIISAVKNELKKKDCMIYVMICIRPTLHELSFEEDKGGGWKQNWKKVKIKQV